ncbi:MAG: cytidine deaminase, partial [Tumebacillaceae bacterium]
MDQQQLIEQAKQARELAYVPYSKFPVGAALLIEGGEVV